MKKEIQQCYELINRLGRGVVYLGSSRMGPGHPHYSNVFHLGREVSPSILGTFLNLAILTRKRWQNNIRCVFELCVAYW